MHRDAELRADAGGELGRCQPRLGFPVLVDERQDALGELVGAAWPLQLCVTCRPRRPSVLDRIRLTQATKYPLPALGGRLAMMSVLDLGEEQREAPQILGPTAGPAGRDDLEGVRRCQARPVARHRANRAARLIPDAIAMTIATLIDERELAPVQRVERMSDANPLSRFPSVGCNW